MQFYPAVTPLWVLTLLELFLFMYKHAPTSPGFYKLFLITRQIQITGQTPTGTAKMEEILTTLGTAGKQLGRILTLPGGGDPTWYQVCISNDRGETMCTYI